MASELEEALADVKQEGTDPFADMETETPTSSPEVKEPEVDKPAEGASTPEENLPFHKHPRWIERDNELKTLREQEEAHAREIAELRALTEDTNKRLEPTDTKIPDWFKELYGENVAAWEKYSEYDRKQREDIKREVVEEQERRQQQQVAEVTRWNKWVDEELTKLEAEGNTFDRNDLIKTMLSYRPTDENNNFDFKKGLEIYKLSQKEPDPAKSIARKQLADQTTASTPGERKAKDYLTPADLRHKSWTSL